MDKKSSILIIILFIAFVYFFSPYGRFRINQTFNEINFFLSGIGTTSVQDIKENPEKYLNKNVTVTGKLTNPSGLYRHFEPFSFFKIDGLEVHGCDRKLGSHKGKITGKIKFFKTCMCKRKFGFDPWRKRIENCDTCKENSTKIHYYIDCEKYKNLS